MPVIKEKTDTNNKLLTPLKDGELLLRLTHGDATKFNEAMNEWGFKDEQSLLRFVVSCLKSSEEHLLAYKKNGGLVQVVPAEELLNNGKK